MKNLADRQITDDTNQSLRRKSSSDLLFYEENKVLFVLGMYHDHYKLIIPRCLVQTLLSSVHERLLTEEVLTRKVIFRVYFFGVKCDEIFIVLHVIAIFAREQNILIITWKS